MQWWEHSPPTSFARDSNPSVNTICGLSLLLVLSLLREVFLRVLRFFLSSKTNIFKFQFDQQSGRRRTTEWMCYLQIVIYLFYLVIYLFTYSFIHSFIYWISPCLLVHLIVFLFSLITRHRRRKDPQMFKNVFKPVSRNLRRTCHCLLLCSDVQTLQL